MNIPAISAEVSVRGTCSTPRPFVNRVAAALGEMAAGILAELNQRLGGSDAVERQAHSISRLAGHITTVDLRDPRLFALLITYQVLKDPSDPKFVAGPEQRRVLAGLGRGTSVDTELTELATAGVEDVAADRLRIVSRLETENTALRASLDRLDRYRRLAAEEDVGRLRGEHMTSPFWKQGLVAQELGAAESELNAARAAESNGDETAAEPAAEPEELPTGVRRRGGSLSIYFRDAAGKQQSHSGFQTVEEAVTARAERVAEVAARKAHKQEVGV